MTTEPFDFITFNEIILVVLSVHCNETRPFDEERTTVVLFSIFTLLFEKELIEVMGVFESNVTARE